jgi:two-component system, NarL family, invasion response regulator UvrY
MVSSVIDRMDDPQSIRVVVADDWPALRRGVVAMLTRDDAILVVAEAASADEVLESVEREKPDVLMLDLGMPGVRGLELVRTVRDRYPTLGLLVFTMHREDEMALAALKAGASGFLNKAASEAEVRHAVRTVAGGRRYLSETMTERLVEETTLPASGAPHESLSDRELDVLCRIAEGAKPGEIATELGISVKTVHTYRMRILEKLKLRTNVDLVLYAVEHRLLGFPQGPRRRPRT